MNSCMLTGMSLMLRSLALMCVCIAAASTYARTQKQLFEFRTTIPNDVIGYRVAGLGDVDGDLHDDFAFSNIYDDTSARDAGAVFVHSGKTGARIRAHYGDMIGDWAGTGLASAGDFDGDGAGDVLVGIYGSDKAHAEGGIVRCYSGKTGTLLREVVSGGAKEEFGIRVRLLGDVDADGVPDWLVAARAGYVWGISAKSGKRLYGVPWEASWFESFAAIGDVDGDLRPDFVVGEPSRKRVQIYSGADGKLLRSVPGDATEFGTGGIVAASGDVDGDGTLDFVASSIKQLSSSSRIQFVRAYSGRSGKELWAWPIAIPNGISGIASLGDVSGDGAPDLLVGIETNSFNSFRGWLGWLSGKTGALLSSVDGAQRGGLGWSVAEAGDVDRDGTPDVIAGTRESPGGSVQVWASRPKGPILGAYSFSGSACRDSTGALWNLAPTDSSVPNVRGGAIRLIVGTPGYVVAPSAAIWLVGFSNVSWNNILLPAPLTPPFLPGCQLLAAPTFQFAMPTPQPNSIRLDLPVPQLAALVGLDVYAQCALYATWTIGTRTLFGLHMTDLARARIGS